MIPLTHRPWPPDKVRGMMVRGIKDCGDRPVMLGDAGPTVAHRPGKANRKQLRLVLESAGCETKFFKEQILSAFPQNGI
jgi:hypothetical protein